MTTFPDEVWLDEHGCLWRSLSPWASDVLILSAPRGDGTWTHTPYEIVHPDGFHKAHPDAVQLVPRVGEPNTPRVWTADYETHHVPLTVDNPQPVWIENEAPPILDSDPDGPNP